MDAELDGPRGKRRLGLAAVVVLLVTLGWLRVDRLREGHAVSPPLPETEDPSRLQELDSAAVSREKARLRKERRELEARIAALAPRGAYVVVDRGNNRIYLRRGDSILVDAPASTGSGVILRETVGQKRSWIFDTPPGRFSVLAKREDPVWTKPDWAFLEEGLPIPDRISDRREEGALGEFALDLGDGYMIHGTLYERLLGRSVTHGCVRVGRDPLRAIAGRTRVGTPVFIY
jgi:L,D-transpeptidase YbiS